MNFDALQIPMHGFSVSECTTTLLFLHVTARTIN